MLKNGIITIFGANVISLMFNLLTSFLLPKYLSVNAYATIKTFQLYVIYVGLFHFGYADGMYLKYGGVSSQKIKKAELLEDITTMRTFQAIVALITILVSVAIKDGVWFAFAISIVPLNMASYYKLLCQATGEFLQYSRVMNVTSIATFVLNMLLLFALNQRESSSFYIFAYVLIYIIIWIYTAKIIKKTYNLFRTKYIGFSFATLKKNITDGILLMLGNLSTAFLTGMDRWFVKYLMNAFSFAQYSFAVSIENFLNVAITPVSVTLYNYFCLHKDIEEQKKAKGAIYFMAVGLPICAFPAQWIMMSYLHNYIESSIVMFLLFASQIFAIIVKCLYVNLYKVLRKQKYYFIKLSYIILIGLVLNIIFYSILHSKEAFAFGTLVSNVTWYIISSLDFKEVKATRRENLYLFSELILFLICGVYMKPILDLFIYILGSICLTGILMKKNVYFTFQLLKKSNKYGG